MVPEHPVAESQPEPKPGLAPEEAVLCVSAGTDAVLLPLRAVQEVLRPLPLTRVPHAPAALLGLANLRGQVLPVASLARLLGIEAAPDDRAARIVVIARGTQRIGLRVDAILPNRTETTRRIDPHTLLPASFAPARRSPERLAPAADDRTADMAVADRRTALLVFRIGDQDFALPLGAVEAVAPLAATGPEAPQPVPDADAATQGLAAWRGAPLPVLSTAVLLGLPKRCGARLLVIRTAGHLCGLAVDSVTGILRVDPAAIAAVPPLLLRGRTAEARVSGICRLANDARLIQILEQNHLLRGSGAALPREIAEPASREPAEAVERVLLVQLGGERYGLPMACVREVARHPGRLARLPNLPAFVEGAITLRGRVLPVIDLAMRFAADADGGDARRIVVVTADELSVGLAVDAVSTIAGFPAGTLPPAPVVFGADAPFDRVRPGDGADAEAPVLLLDPAALLRGVDRDLAAAMRASRA